jgi:hypothetical protein
MERIRVVPGDGQRINETTATAPPKRERCGFCVRHFDDVHEG